jgi:hypothetical protein
LVDDTSRDRSQGYGRSRLCGLPEWCSLIGRSAETQLTNRRHAYSATWHRETAAPDIAQYRRAWRSIRNARSPLFRRMRPGRRLIHIISDAEPTNSADSVQTLLKGYKAAIRGSTGSRSVLCAPRIVLRFSGFRDAEDRCKNSRNEQQTRHVQVSLGDPN